MSWSRTIITYRSQDVLPRDDVGQMAQLWTARVDTGNGRDLYGDDFADIWAINRLHFKAASPVDCDHVSTTINSNCCGLSVVPQPPATVEPTGDAIEALTPRRSQHSPVNDVTRHQLGCVNSRAAIVRCPRRAIGKLESHLTASPLASSNYMNE